MIKPILKTFPDQFETERLFICAPHPSHIEPLHEAVVASWERLRPWMPWAAAPEPQSLEETSVFTRQAYIKFLERTDLRLHLFLKGSNIFIGGSGLHRINWSVPAFEIGYWVRTGYEGQGYVTEAVAGITDFAFQELGARRVEIRCDVNNKRSVAVAKRAGYTLEGTFHCHGRHHLTGQLRDTYIFAKVRRDDST